MPLPGVKEAVAFGEIDAGAKEAGEVRGGEQIALGTVGEDAAVFHEEEAINLGDDVGGVVGDEQDCGSLPGELAEEVAKLLLRGEVEGIRGFIKEEHLAGCREAGQVRGRADRRPVRRFRLHISRLQGDGWDGQSCGGCVDPGGGAGAGQCAGDEDAALLAGGHLADEPMT